MIHRECHCLYDESGIRYCDDREHPDHTIEQKEWVVDMPCQTHQSHKSTPFSTWFFDRASEFKNETYSDVPDGDSTSDDSSYKTDEEAHHIGNLEVVETYEQDEKVMDRLGQLVQEVVSGMWSKSRQ